MKDEPIIVERLLDAPPEKVWKAITEKEGMKKWGFEIAEFKPVVGFEFRFLGGKDDKKYLHICKVTEVVPGKKLAYSWRYDGYAGMSHVRIELESAGSKTKITLTHRGVETFPANVPDLARENFVFGWTAIVNDIIKGEVEGTRSAI